MSNPTSDKTRAAQVFHNFMDLMVKSEMYPGTAAEVKLLLDPVLEECALDMAADPESLIEQHWSLVVSAFMRYLIAIDDEESGIDEDLDKVVSIFGTTKNGEDDSA